MTWVEKMQALDADPSFNEKTRYQKQKQVSTLYENYRHKGAKMLSGVDPEVALKVEMARETTKEMRGKGVADAGDEIDVSEESGNATPPQESTPIDLMPAPINETAPEAPAP
jgi:hypothetical protein